MERRCKEARRRGAAGVVKLPRVDWSGDHAQTRIHCSKWNDYFTRHNLTSRVLVKSALPQIC